ncbi:alpha/beta fold hydrolase [Georgenia sp. H159]|uniref:alpha/beta fold hydrolase n=1 Tax=Georgenia sp. H159 TaxID=3076115 RepID=UPI002D77027C|nr:alpha/beta fold hydrolase [Georgenia sp. H159]
MTTDSYQLEVRAHPPRAVLAGTDGRIWSHLSLLASVDRTDVADVSWDVGPASVSGPTADGRVEVVLRLSSSAWDRKEVRLTCTPGEVALSATVTGRGILAEVGLLGGRASLATSACGWFWSSAEHASVFTPAPTEPIEVVRPAAAPVTLGVVGDASPGRLHGIFSPPPLCLALGRETSTGPTDVPGGDWLGMWLRAPVEDLTFTQLRYLPSDGGFRVALDYDGHTRVEGTFTTPELVLRPGESPHRVLEHYRSDLVGRGLAPDGPGGRQADWWAEPIVCGWGVQCALAPLPGARAGHPWFLDDLPPAVVPDGVPIAPDMSRQDVYDTLLATLAEHDVVPGTVVVDDRWQEHYGTLEPHPGRWPELRAWVAERHAAGQRVLLWWKAWDPAGLPDAECVVDPSGRAVAADPGNPAYLARVATVVRHLLGPDGIDADGFKIDFTQRAPAGVHLRAWTDDHPSRPPPVWGVAALHRLLRTIYAAAKAAKPDALLVTHTPHPSFADVCDMVRTNDVLGRGPAGAVVPVGDQLAARAAVVRAVLPGHLVDTDQWPMPDRDQWRRYVVRQAELGVPALYYSDRLDRSGEELTASDLALVARTWARYRERAVGKTGRARRGRAILGSMSSGPLALHRHGPAGGRPLVLLHGFPLDSRMWDDVVARLTDLPVVTVDAPGFGGSPAPDDVAAAVGREPGPSLETYADAVAATLRAEGIDRAVVAGLSMGGYALLALAERHRGLLAAVGLLDTRADADADDARANRLRVAEEAERTGADAVAGMVETVLGETTLAERPQVVARMREWLSQAPAEGISWAQRAMAGRPARLTAVEDLEVPGLVLRGAEDKGSPQSAAQAMAHALGGGAELVVVPRAGHMTAIEDPDAVADALRRLHASADA